MDWELVLAADHVHSALGDLDSERWREALPVLHDDFQHLLRDAWQAIWERDPGRATRIAQDWFDVPYPTFKRLALFAASQHGCITPDQWTDWLVNDDARWLWSEETQRETMRLLVLQGANLPAEAGAKLEAAILAGPPRAIDRDDLKPERGQLLLDPSVWLRLAKLEEGGRTLGEAASQRFAGLSTANPEWKLADHERDEFLPWMSGVGDPDNEKSLDIHIAPLNRRDLVTWLKQPPPEHPFYEDTWRETCRTRFADSLFALRHLAQEEEQWPTQRWREALQAWSEEGTIGRSWRCAAPLMKNMPNEVLQEVAHNFTKWLKAASKSIDRHETVLLDLCRRVLALRHLDYIETEQPVTAAINHPVGHVTQALLNLWFTREPNDDDTLPSDIELIFTRLCDTGTETEVFRHGRVLLASRLIALFRVDPCWTETHLLPLFDWKTCPTEAKAVWEGFLWGARLHPRLLIAFKPHFLETAHHYANLGERSRHFVAFLTYAALDRVDGYTDQDFRTAVGALPPEGLREAAMALSQALESAGEQREDYWKNRVQPFWKNVCPSRAISPQMALRSLSHA